MTEELVSSKQFKYQSFVTNGLMIKENPLLNSQIQHNLIVFIQGIYSKQKENLYERKNLTCQRNYNISLDMSFLTT